jgi:hypothetical protein
MRQRWAITRAARRCRLSSSATNSDDGNDESGATLTKAGSVPRAESAVDVY